MKKLIAVSALLLPFAAAALFAAGTPVPAAASAASPRQAIPWDSGWLFSKSDSAMAMAPTFADASWRAVRVPHDWSMEEPFSADYGSGNGYAAGGVGWYRKHFTLDPAQKNRLVTVEFDGVYDHAEVWINGQFVGGRPYGYSSFQFDLTRHLRFDGDNVLAVRVDHSRYADSRFYTGSGIYRHVWLCLTDRLHIGQWGTFVTTPKVSAEAALVRVETTVVNDAVEPREFALQAEVIAADGRVVASRTTTTRLGAGQSQSLVQEIEVTKPQRWSLEAPELYTLRNRVSLAGAATDETSTPFGIRTIAFDPDKGFLLNGQSVKLKGVCIHHDAGSLGAAVPDEVLERRLRALRDLGVNAIRTSHNPPAPELLTLCDRLGLLVKDETFDEFTPTKKKWVQGWNVGEPGKFGYGESFQEWSVRDTEDLVRRDRNHPSVIMWSIGNEIDYANDPFSHPVLGNSYRPQNPPASDLVKLGAPLIAAVKRFDTTRPVTAALAHVEMSDAVGFGELFDVVGYNYQELRYPADHAKFPKRVIFGSENRHDYSAWAVVRDNDYISGQFLWTGIDYLGEAGKFPNRGSGSGLLDLCGFKKPQAWFRQSLWSNLPMVYLSAAVETAPTRASASSQGAPVLDRARRSRTEEHWNWPQSSTIAVTCYSNCPEIQLTLNGRAIGTKRLTEAVEGVLIWTVPYEPGTLKAVGLKEGKSVCEFALQTAGPASRIELLPDTIKLAADGNAVCHVEYRIVDANGVRVPDAAQAVTFEVTGPAELIGLGNGDLSNCEDPRGRVHQTYLGRGLAILQSKTAAGGITVKATAPGLAPAQIVLNSQN
jgi:beta-galactosidase